MEWVRGATVGRGSFATVSLAVVNGALIAAKSVPASNSSLLQHEETILKDLQDCPQIISCFGHDVTDESDGQQLYNLFLEYVPGGSLADLLRRSPLPESAVKKNTGSILEALRFLHGRGYVHCDVKPQNILVSSNGDVKIADFGLAKKRKEKTEYSVRGTPLYMSPESVAKKMYEAPMDIWSVGCVVAEMVTGKPAWGRSWNYDIWGLMRRIGFGDEMPETPAEISEQGKDFLRRCFIRDPDTRWTAEMLLKHPFVAVDSEEDGVVGISGCVDSQRMSPRSMFCFSRCDCDDESSSTSVCSSSDFCDAAVDWIGLRATGPPMESWGCESCDGWIRVRGEESTVPLKLGDDQHWASSSSSSSWGNLNRARERIGLLASGELPDSWCSSSPVKDGWIMVREAEGLMKRLNCENVCHTASEECCKNSILKEYKYWEF